MTRVLVTSMAPVTPIGTGVDAFMAGMANGDSGIGEIRNFDITHFPVRIGAEVVQNGSEVPNQGGRDRKEVFLEIAMEQLVAGPVLKSYAPDARSLLLGMGIDYLRLDDFCESEDASVHRWVPYSVNTVKMAHRLGDKYHLRGNIHVNVSACVASSQAMGLAFRLLKRGQRKLMVVGGADSMLNPLHYIGFYKLGALAPDTCRPYDAQRKGLVLGEGAVLFTFESDTTAQRENVLFEVCGYGASMDAYMITDPLPDGAMLASAAQWAIAEAGISPDDIDCVHAHGTGTPKNDIMEYHALRAVFGDRALEIPVFSMKSRVGHMIAACGAAEFAGCAYAFAAQEVPATLNHNERDPEIPLNLFKQPQSLPIRNILKLNAAFGGQNTAFVLKRYEH